MSTSLAVQPAYRATLLERTKANPDRTIFGTTLDNYQKCWKLLNDPKGKFYQYTQWRRQKFAMGVGGWHDYSRGHAPRKILENHSKN